MVDLIDAGHAPAGVSVRTKDGTLCFSAGGMSSWYAVQCEYLQDQMN